MMAFIEPSSLASDSQSVITPSRRSENSKVKTKDPRRPDGDLATGLSLVPQLSISKIQSHISRVWREPERVIPLDYEFLAAGIAFAVGRFFLGVLRLVRFWATRSATAVIKSSLSISGANSSWRVVFVSTNERRALLICV